MDGVKIDYEKDPDWIIANTLAGKPGMPEYSTTILRQCAEGKPWKCEKIRIKRDTDRARERWLIHSSCLPEATMIALGKAKRKAAPKDKASQEIYELDIGRLGFWKTAGVAAKMLKTLNISQDPLQRRLLVLGALVEMEREVGGSVEALKRSMDFVLEMENDQ